MTTYSLHIQYHDRPAEIREFSKPEVIIGREAADISLGDPLASGHHGKLVLDPRSQTLTYTDLNSSNGSRFLNGQPITAPAQFGPGHAVRIGNCIITVRSIGGTQQRANPNRGGTVLGGVSPLAGGLPSAAKPPPASVPVAAPVMPPVAAPVAAPVVAVAAAAGAGKTPNEVPMATVNPAPISFNAATEPVPQANVPVPQDSPATPASEPSLPPSQPVGDLLDPKRTTSFGEAWGLLMKTWPYLVARWTVYGLYALGCLVWFCVWGGLAYLFRESGSVVTVLLIIAVGGFGAIAYWLKRYVLYLLKAGHIAVITELIKHGTLPEGKNQVEYGKGIVTERFGEVTALFAVDALVTGILRMISRTIIGITNLIPIPGLDKIGRIVTAIINRALTYIDEAIFSYTLLTGSTNPWASARTGIVLYGQSWKPLLKSAFKVWLLGQVAWFVAFLVILLPTYGLMALMPDASLILGIMAVILALLVVSAFYEPLALVYMILTYNRAIQGQTPSAEWEEKIGKVSSKFRSMSEKAANWVSQKKSPQPTPPAA